MPMTRGKAKKGNKNDKQGDKNAASSEDGGMQSKIAKVPKVQTKKQTAYERICAKLEEKKCKLQQEVQDLEEKLANGSDEASQVSSTKRTDEDESMEVNEQENINNDPEITFARFREEDSYVEMEVEGINKEFMSEDEQEENEAVQADSNNNAAVGRIEGTQGRCYGADGKQINLPDGDEVSPGRESNVDQSFAVLQNIMISKGIITEGELADLLQTGDGFSVGNTGQTKTPQKRKERAENTRSDVRVPPAKRKGNSNASASEATVYQRVVKQVRNSLQPNQKDSNKINEFLALIRKDNEKQCSRKFSSLSEEMMDTSDECDLFSGSVQAGRSADPNYSMTPRKTPEENAEEIISDSERNKPVMHEVPGKFTLFSTDTYKIDENYQMIDAHIDDHMRRKIQSFEFVEFGKLLQKGKTVDDNRMEIVTKNGFTFLLPVSDRESSQINSFNKWEQAFRVYSNVLTSKYPCKATELLQYNHTIQTTSASYYWDNVAAYDREFRQHISRHPGRSWSVILQQAWTMLLKDRVKNNNSLFQKGHLPGGKQNKKDREPCRRFNKGKCTFGLSCKFDHRCSVPKCGKFGHGAHICRL